MPRLELEITEALDGRTVRSLLRGELGLSAGCVGRLKRAEGGITVGGVRVFTNAVLQTGDTLTVDLDAAERPTAVEPVPMELDIAFEDEHLLILNKAAPLAVIPSSFSPGEPTLAGGLAHYLGPGFSFHPVNRLDRGSPGRGPSNCPSAAPPALSSPAKWTAADRAPSQSTGCWRQGAASPW